MGKPGSGSLIGSELSFEHSPFRERVCCMPFIENFKFLLEINKILLGHGYTTLLSTKRNGFPLDGASGSMSVKRSG